MRGSNSAPLSPLVPPCRPPSSHHHPLGRHFHVCPNTINDGYVVVDVFSRHLRLPHRQHRKFACVWKVFMRRFKKAS
jgi:hypothetical protein